MVQGLDQESEGKLPPGSYRKAYRIRRQVGLDSQRLRTAAASGLANLQLDEPAIQRGRAALLTPCGCHLQTIRLAHKCHEVLTVFR
jgi:hypothetical protein